MNSTAFIIISAISGVIWGAIATSTILFNDPVGTNCQIPSWAGMLAGAFTGVVIALFSRSAYILYSTKHLLWITPLSLYCAIAIFIPSALFMSHGIQADKIISTILLSWLALTFWFTLWPLFLLSYCNHRWLHNLTNKENKSQ